VCRSCVVAVFGKMGCASSSEKGAVEARPAASPMPATAVPLDDEPDSPPVRSSMYQARELPSERFSRPDLRKSEKSAVFDTQRIGVATKHGIAPVMGGAKGKINQDRGLVSWPFNGSTAQALLCVFDGHGRNGEKVSEYCMKNITHLLEADPAALKNDTVGYMTKQIIQMDAQLDTANELLARISRTAGTTSTVAYLRGNSVWVACSGDSRAVLGSQKDGMLVARDLSMDHKPDLPKEKARIVKAGGRVSMPGPNGLPPGRVWSPDGCGLAMSRSIGDKNHRNIGCIPDPDVVHATISPVTQPKGDGDLFIIVASDGVWEFIPSEEACDIVNSYDDASKAVQKLVAVAKQRWKEEEGNYRDDITAVVAMLPFLDEDDEDVGDQDGIVEVNKGATGLAKFKAPSAPKPVPASFAPVGDNEKGTHEDFVARRLSTTAPIDVGDDWAEDSDDDDDDGK
jgi:protein phosphatase 2C family protein 2/3